MTTKNCPSQQKDPLFLPQWRFFEERQPYEPMIQRMAETVKKINADKNHPGEIWVLEHESVYTMGASADEKDFLQKPKYPVVKTGRGGKITYHGPGMLIVYPLLNISHQKDLRAYVQWIEQWMQRILENYGIDAHPSRENVGLWVTTPTGDEKIGSIGIRVQRWTTLHGFALNINPDLDAFSAIVPCGIQGAGVSSVAALGKKPVQQVQPFDVVKETFQPFV